MRFRLPSILLVAILVLAACADTQRESPKASSEDAHTKPTHSSPSQPTDSGSARNVPDVTNPIDTTAFEQAPCSVLTRDQLNRLSISSDPDPKMTESGPSCTWGDLFEDGIHASGAFLTKQPSTIAGLYKNHQLGRYSYFIPVEIQGYPAVFSQIGDGRPNGGCGIAIALRQKFLYSISFRLGEDYPGYSDPCSVLKKVAEMAVKTMTNGGS